MGDFSPGGGHLAEAATDAATAAGGSLGLGGDEGLSADEDGEEACARIGVKGGAWGMTMLSVVDAQPSIKADPAMKLDVSLKVRASHRCAQRTGSVNSACREYQTLQPRHSLLACAVCSSIVCSIKKGATFELFEETRVWSHLQRRHGGCSQSCYFLPAGRRHFGGQNRVESLPHGPFS